MPTTKQTLAALAAAALASTTPFALAGAVDRDDTSTDEVDDTFVIEDEQGTDDDGTVLLTLEAETDDVDTEEETDLEAHDDGETFGAWVSSLSSDKTWYEGQGYKNKGQYVSEHARARGTDEAEDVEAAETDAPEDTQLPEDVEEAETDAPEDTQLPEDVEDDDASDETNGDETAGNGNGNGNGNGGNGGNGAEDDADDLDDEAEADDDLADEG